MFARSRDCTTVKCRSYLSKASKVISFLQNQGDLSNGRISLLVPVVVDEYFNTIYQSAPLILATTSIRKIQSRRVGDVS